LVKAQLELQLREIDAFQMTCAQLRRRAPGHMGTHYFAANGPAIKEQWATAEREIHEAERLGLPSEEARKFLAGGIASRARAWRWAKLIGCAVGVWALGLVLMFLGGKERTDIGRPHD